MPKKIRKTIYFTPAALTKLEQIQKYYLQTAGLEFGITEAVIMAVHGHWARTASEELKDNIRNNLDMFRNDNGPR